MLKQLWLCANHCSEYLMYIGIFTKLNFLFLDNCRFTFSYPCLVSLMISSCEMITHHSHLSWGFPGGSVDKESTCNEGDPGQIPGSGGSPGEGNSTPLQYAYLESSMDRGAWWAPVLGLQRTIHNLSTKPLIIFRFPQLFMY